MMIKFCPATCGLCLTKRCRDQIDDCEAMKSLCTNELYVVFMEHQCAKVSERRAQTLFILSTFTIARLVLRRAANASRTMTTKIRKISSTRSTKRSPKSRRRRREKQPVSVGVCCAPLVARVLIGSRFSGSRTQLPSGPYAPENAGAGGAAAGGSSASGGGGSGGGGGGGSNKECVDLMKNCQRNKKFCFHPSYREMMMKNCAKTCGLLACDAHFSSSKTIERIFAGFCKPNGAAPVNKKTATRTTRECRDAHPFCVS